MTDALLILALLGLAWALVGGLVLMQRLRSVERLLHQERADTATRLEALESLARDRWLSEAASLGDQVTAMIQALQEAASQSAGEAAQRRAELTALLEQADQRLAALRGALAAAPVPTALPARPRAARRLDVAGTGVPAIRPETAPAPAAVARHREVRRLAADGLSTADIARRTGLGIAEIDLVLRLARPEPLQRLA
jgi:hypothetical protein